MKLSLNLMTINRNIRNLNLQKIPSFRSSNHIELSRKKTSTQINAQNVDCKSMSTTELNSNHFIFSSTPINTILNKYTYGRIGTDKNLRTGKGLFFDCISFSRQPSKTINKAIVSCLEIPNLKLVSSSVLRGSTLENNFEKLQELKKANIECIVDLRKECNPSYAEKCEELGLSYFNFPLDGIFNLSATDYFEEIGKNKRVKDEFVCLLKEFFEILNSKKVYIACKHGIDRTNVAIVLDYLLNKNSQLQTPSLLCWQDESVRNIVNRNISIVKRIYKCLNEQQKMQLGIDEGFKNEFQERSVFLRRGNK